MPSDLGAPPLLTIDETARLLRCGTTLVKVLIRTDRIRYVKVGRLTRIPRSEVDGIVDGSIRVAGAEPPVMSGVVLGRPRMTRRSGRGSSLQR